MISTPTDYASVRFILDAQNAEDLKKLLALVPGVKLKAPRKLDVIEALEGYLFGSGALDLWNRLDPLEKAAVAEAVHGPDGELNEGAFVAKHGQLPAFATKEENHWARKPTLLRLLLHPSPGGFKRIPRDLREKLLAFVPKPDRAKLNTLPAIPPQAVRERTIREWKGAEVVYRSEKVPLIERLSEQSALQDLRTVLRLVDQEKLRVSAKTFLPSNAAMAVLDELLHGHDYFPLVEKREKWHPELGGVKTFSWPLLVQASKLGRVSGEKLSLTKNGRTALDAPAAETLRSLWEGWLKNGIIDEFRRIDTIKGQQGKGARGFTPPEQRRRAITEALVQCPVGEWVETTEFSRFMRAAGFEFQVHGNPWVLYICDPQYGSLGYAGYGGWNILQERYMLCFLFEYAATLGIIDIAYEHPAGARTDYRGQWGTDDLIFLSRYDGLKYFRLTNLGAFILGTAPAYEPGDLAPGVSLTVLPNGRVNVDQGELSPDQTLLLEEFADREGPAQWSMNEAKALLAVEKGVGIAQFRAFLAAGDPQPLPEKMEGFLAGVEQRGAACVFKRKALLIECLSSEVAEIIATNFKTGKLCQRTGDRSLVVIEDKEKAFREALHSIGYGMPRV